MYWQPTMVYNLTMAEEYEILRVDEKGYAYLLDEVDKQPEDWSEEYCIHREFLLRLAPRFFKLLDSLPPEGTTTSFLAKDILNKPFKHAMRDYMYLHPIPNMSERDRCRDNIPRERYLTPESKWRAYGKQNIASALWRFLIVSVALNPEMPDSAVRIVASLVTSFLRCQLIDDDNGVGTRGVDIWNQDYFSSRSLKGFLRDKIISDKGGFWCTSNDDTRTWWNPDLSTEIYNRTAKLNAYLVRYGNPVGNCGFFSTFSWAFGTAVKEDSCTGQGMTYPTEEKLKKEITREELSILALPDVLDIAGAKMYCLCFRPTKDSNGEDVVVQEYCSDMSMPDETESEKGLFSERNWKFWKSAARAIGEDETRKEEVRNAAVEIAKKMEELEDSTWDSGMEGLAKLLNVA